MRRGLILLGVLMVICSCGGGGGSVGINPPPVVNPISVTISPATLTRIDQGQSLAFTVAVLNDSDPKGVTWSASGTGLTGTAAGSFGNVTAGGATYIAPLSVTGNVTITVTATSVADPTKTSSTPVVVSPPPSISAANLAPASPNSNYSAALRATGGAGTLIWSVAGGALPIGLALSSSGTIAGDPTVPGTWTFTVKVTDSSAATSGQGSAQAQFSLTVVTPVTIPTSSLPAGSEGAAYLAQVEAAGGTPPYSWSLTAGSLPAGLTLQSSSGVISGAPGSQGTFTFTVAARDSSPTQQTQTKPFSMAVGSPGPLTITTSSLLDGTVNAPYHAQVAAMGGAPPYTWTILSGTLPASLSLNSSTGAISGTVSSTGTTYFTVRVKDSGSTPQTQTQPLSVTIVAPPAPCASSGNNAALSGSYAFSLSGFNGAGFSAVVGSFTADGSGHLTAGEADANGVLGVQHADLLAAASSYSVGTDGRGCATLATPFGTFVTRLALGTVSSNPATAGRMIEWDSPSASAFVATGQLLRQESVPANVISGPYAYRTAGWDAAPLGGREACVGAITAVANTLSNMEQDCNDAGTVATTGAPDVSGTYTSPDAHGRGTAILAMGEVNAGVAFYAVSSARLLVLTSDVYPALSGEWDQQSVPAGASAFTAAALSGNMVFHLSGLSLGGTATAVSLETAHADGASSINLNFYEDRAGTMQVSSSYTCTYAVETNGRVTLSSASQSCGGLPPVLYLTGQNSGFIVDAAPGVDSGSFEAQAAGPFNDASLSGLFFGGTEEADIPTAVTEVDSVAPNGSGGFSLSTFDNSSTSSQDAGSSFPAGSYNVNPDGTFTTDSSGGSVTGIVISNTKFVMFSPSTLTSLLPTVLVLQR